MGFLKTLQKAKRGNSEAIEHLFQLYLPLLKRSAAVDGVFDEDLFQELCCVFLLCIGRFRID